MRAALALLSAMVLAVCGWIIWTGWGTQERTVCSDVTPLDQAFVSADSAPPLWQDAFAQPGTMFELHDPETRYRYFPAHSTTAQDVYFDGQFRKWSVQTAQEFCTFMDQADTSRCRFFQDGPRHGFLIFTRDHVLESGTDYIDARAAVIQSDGSQLELFTVTRNTHEVEAAECDMAKALWTLAQPE